VQHVLCIISCTVHVYDVVCSVRTGINKPVRICSLPLVYVQLPGGRGGVGVTRTEFKFQARLKPDDPGIGIGAGFVRGAGGGAGAEGGGAETRRSMKTCCCTLKSASRGGLCAFF
jgi:hypothetical protein